MIRARLLTVFLGVLAVLILAACSSSEKPEEKPAPAPAVEAPVPAPTPPPPPTEPVPAPQPEAKPEAKTEAPAQVKNEDTIPAKATPVEKPKAEAAPAAKPTKPKKAASSVPGPEKVLMLTAPAEMAAKQPPVSFSHTSHAKTACTDCHHTWKGAGKIDSCSKAGCHDLFKAETPEEKKSIKKYDKAFHDQCIPCHRKEKAAGNAKIPTACAECHKK